jgi:hypothetical protein
LLIDRATYFSTGPRSITVCASDVPDVAVLSSCSDARVNALVAKNVSIEPMVSKSIVITDTLPMTTDQIGASYTDPVVDGAPFDLKLTLHNLEPNDTSGVLDATDIVFEAMLADGLTIIAGGGVTIAGDAVNPACVTGVGRLDCEFAALPPAGQVSMTVTVAGNGTTWEDRDLAVVALASSAEDDHNGMVGNSKSYRVLVDPDGDADGDGVQNALDAFPGDPNESQDTDGDGIGNNGDLEDDGDGMPDAWEQRFGLDPLSAADAGADPDGDGLSNADEYRSATRPDTSDSDADGVADNADNCPATFNARQFDSGGEGNGDVCDSGSVALAGAFGDLNGNGAADAALLRMDAGAAVVYVKDGETDHSVATIAALSAGRVPRHLFAVPNLDARPAIALLWSDADGSGVVAYDAASGGLLAEYALPDADRSIVDAAVLGSGPDTQFAVLGANVAGEAAIDLIDADTGSVSESWEFFGPDHEALRLVVTENVAAVLAVSPTGELELEVRARTSGELQRSAVVAGPDWLSIDLAQAGEDALLVVKELGGGQSLNLLSLTGAEPDRAFSIGATGDAAVTRALADNSEATLLMVDSSGDTSLRRFALDDGRELQATPVLSADSEPRALFTFEGGQLGVLGSDAGGDVFAEQRDTDGGRLPATLTAQASSPPPPPAPPPTDTGGGGGGAVDGCFIAFLGAVFMFGRRRCRLFIAADPNLT